jgi:cytochrome c-type biogenesis protein CcmH/NrfF
VRALVAAAIGIALVCAAPAVASERHPTLNELEGEVMCPICHTTLDQSDSPAAQRIKAYITRRIRAGDTKSEIKRQLVADFGPGILAEPAKHGFALLAWLLPIGGILVGAAGLGFAAWRWSRTREPAAALAGGVALDPELDRRLDDELRRFE